MAAPRGARVAAAEGTGASGPYIAGQGADAPAGSGAAELSQLLFALLTEIPSGATPAWLQARIVQAPSLHRLVAQADPTIAEPLGSAGPAAFEEYLLGLQDVSGEILCGYAAPEEVMDATEEEAPRWSKESWVEALLAEAARDLPADPGPDALRRYFAKRLEDDPALREHARAVFPVLAIAIEADDAASFRRLLYHTPRETPRDDKVPEWRPGERNSSPHGWGDWLSSFSERFSRASVGVARRSSASTSSRGRRSRSSSRSKRDETPGRRSGGRRSGRRSSGGTSDGDSEGGRPSEGGRSTGGSRGASPKRARSKSPWRLLRGETETMRVPDPSAMRAKREGARSRPSEGETSGVEDDLESGSFSGSSCRSSPHCTAPAPAPSGRGAAICTSKAGRSSYTLSPSLSLTGNGAASGRSPLPTLTPDTSSSWADRYSPSKLLRSATGWAGDAPGDGGEAGALAAPDSPAHHIDMRAQHVQEQPPGRAPSPPLHTLMPTAARLPAPVGISRPAGRPPPHTRSPLVLPPGPIVQRQHKAQCGRQGSRDDAAGTAALDPDDDDETAA